MNKNEQIKQQLAVLNDDKKLFQSYILPTITAFVLTAGSNKFFENYLYMIFAASCVVALFYLRNRVKSIRKRITSLTNDLT